MNFDDTPETAAYRAAARAWLAEHAAPHRADRLGAPDDTQAEYYDLAKAWTREKSTAGYSCITLPKAWGGGEGTPIERAIFEEEEKAAGINYPFIMWCAHGMATPTILEAGNEEQKQQFVPAAIRGEHIWCQLFSEPSGGSDIAAARTRAVRDGDDWVVNGQKIWTSFAQWSDYGLLLARTDPTVPKHKGLTMFIVDMKAPGVDVRPLRQMSGASEFNEVFFTDLRLPDSARLGEVNKGWHVALITMMNERLTVGGASGPDHRDLINLARELPGQDGAAIADSAVREKIADWYILFEGLKLTRMRSMTALARGDVPGPENSIGKLLAASATQNLVNDALELQGSYGLLSGGENAIAEGFFQHQILHTPCERIAGGTDEIQRNIIAERVLGLPGDIRVDKDIAFNDL